MFLPHSKHFLLLLFNPTSHEYFPNGLFCLLIPFTHCCMSSSKPTSYPPVGIPDSRVLFDPPIGKKHHSPGHKELLPWAISCCNGSRGSIIWTAGKDSGARKEPGHGHLLLSGLCPCSHSCQGGRGMLPDAHVCSWMREKINL